MTTREITTALAADIVASVLEDRDLDVAVTASTYGMAQNAVLSIVSAYGYDVEQPDHTIRATLTRALATLRGRAEREAAARVEASDDGMPSTSAKAAQAAPAVTTSPRETGPAGDKPEVLNRCRVCGRIFHTLRARVTHERIHSDVVLECPRPGCDFTTRATNALANHEKAHARRADGTAQTKEEASCPKPEPRTTTSAPPADSSVSGSTSSSPRSETGPRPGRPAKQTPRPGTSAIAPQESDDPTPSTHTSRPSTGADPAPSPRSASPTPSTSPMTTASGEATPATSVAESSVVAAASEPLQERDPILPVDDLGAFLAAGDKSTSADARAIAAQIRADLGRLARALAVESELRAIDDQLSELTARRAALVASIDTPRSDAA